MFCFLIAEVMGFSGEEICKRKAFGSLFGVERESGLGFFFGFVSARVSERFAGL